MLSSRALERGTRRLEGLQELLMQYHPEVVHSERGINTLRRFLTEIAGLEGDWTMQSVIDAEKKVIADKVGPDAQVICALSGGVDSTVAATLVHSVRSYSALQADAVLTVCILPASSMFFFWRSVATG